MKILITGGNGFIGTNLVEALREYQKGSDVFIIDIDSPKIELQKNELWYNIDILNYPELLSKFIEVKPDVVVHMAAVTDCDPRLVMQDYLTNTKGSENVFNAADQSNPNCFVVNVSTQYVNQSDVVPTADDEYAPHTVYGESKIIAENTLRNGNYSFNWVTVRPTNIWGKWHLRYPHEFWKVVKQGKYFHPGSKKVQRSYGYVGNVCIQIIKLIENAQSPKVSKKFLYVGDRPLYLYDWANSFSKAITGKPARVVPSFMVYTLAVVGSGLQKINVKFPITLSRYKNMISENPAPMEPTFKVTGESRYSVDEGVEITTKWLKGFWEKNGIV
ncbi:NAD-dependent epimerase/dehydratase family protein [Mucilaginibacter ginsenosidivorax]|uniref:NAD(P)-dependent oxidoreductase n=1 Tax=Mucilaginibacter ginsenosidivorax TaxID=862126 RepID=A0A5B8W2X8_9SPHI|nr:NAD(P)-dependent oxidoreductase [Mucilaginibacter ginsenosidivorax]QEC78083.1 NAD(P)-dependent oxidoreductase [Mucilaginibacter ginsenosidivorax]